MNHHSIALDLKSQGFAVVSTFVSQYLLQQLQEEAEVVRELSRDRTGIDVDSLIFEPITSTDIAADPSLATSLAAFLDRRRRYPFRSAIAEFLTSPTSHLVKLANFLLRRDDTTTQIVGATDIHLLNEQYIIKPGGSGNNEATAFAWHRDADYLPKDTSAVPGGSCEEGTRYISVWIALDDMSADNGCLWVIPGSHRDEDAATTAAIQLQPLPAGTAVVTSHALLHCSGPNTTQFARRAWMPQFSRDPVVAAVSTPSANIAAAAIPRPIALAIPLSISQK